MADELFASSFWKKHTEHMSNPLGQINHLRCLAIRPFRQTGSGVGATGGTKGLWFGCRFEA